MSDLTPEERAELDYLRRKQAPRPMSGALGALGREIHRAWFLTWRIPGTAWHHREAERHARLAQSHRDRMVANSSRALELAAQYPSKIHPRGDS